MFRHIVLLAFTDEATDDRIDHVVEGLRGLPDAIPVIRSYLVGRDAGLAPGNADVVVVADFDDEAAYLEYRDHAVHRDVIATRISPVLASRVALQHEY